MDTYRFNTKTILTFCLLLAFIVGTLSVSALAQGTSLSLEGEEISEGDEVTIFLNLDKALDGLGRLDASIVSSDPGVVELTSIAPEAVSEQFLQVDSEEKDEIAFKMVDLGKSIDPGDENVQLLSINFKAMTQGEAEISLKDITYTDEDGNVVEPQVTPATIKVEPKSAPKAEKEDQTKPAEEEEVDEDKEDKEEDRAEEEEKEETAPTQEEERAGYVPQLEGAELKLGESSKIPLVLSSLPDGLRLAEFRIVSSGEVTFDRVIVLNPSYSVVVEKTDRLISVRVGDFDDEISPGTGELKIAEVGINAVKVGETKLRTRFVGWGDEGSKVTRQGEPAIVAVTLGKVGKSQNPPKDLDGDGLYEDVNGDGKLTQEDAFTLAFNLQSESIQHSASLFDFNWDGKVSFADAAELIHMISG